MCSFYICIHICMAGCQNVDSWVQRYYPHFLWGPPHKYHVGPTMSSFKRCICVAGAVTQHPLAAWWSYWTLTELALTLVSKKTFPQSEAISWSFIPSYLGKKWAYFHQPPTRYPFKKYRQVGAFSFPKPLFGGVADLITIIGLFIDPLSHVVWLHVDKHPLEGSFPHSLWLGLLFYRMGTRDLHPGRLTWNIIIEVWKIIFLSKWVICTFHVNLPGCNISHL